jgi:hypothetical protein
MLTGHSGPPFLRSGLEISVPSQTASGWSISRQYQPLAA